MRAPAHSADLWHVSSLPKAYLTAGMATIVVIRDESIGTAFHYCRIDEQGFLRVLDTTEGLGYVEKQETSIEGAIPPREGDD